MAESEIKAAPHGRDENGEPNAPFGLNLDGTPRKSNRGARAGQRGNANSRNGKTGAARIVSSSKSDKERREALLGLADMLLVTPLAAVSQAPGFAKRFGEKQSDALAGDAIIVANFAPQIADGLIILSQTKPGALAWLDRIEEKAPYLVLMQAGLGIAKALVENHTDPNPAMAEAGRNMLRIRASQYAAEVNRQAAAMFSDSGDVPAAA